MLSSMLPLKLIGQTNSLAIHNNESKSKTHVFTGGLFVEPFFGDT